MNPQEKIALKTLAMRLARKWNMLVEQVADVKEALDMTLALIGQVTTEEEKVVQQSKEKQKEGKK